MRKKIGKETKAKKKRGRSEEIDNERQAMKEQRKRGGNKE